MKLFNIFFTIRLDLLLICGGLTFRRIIKGPQIFNVKISGGILSKLSEFMNLACKLITHFDSLRYELKLYVCLVLHNKRRNLIVSQVFQRMI